MIRVAILADTTAKAHSLADLLAEDDRLQIVLAGSVTSPHAEDELAYADALLLASPGALPQVSAGAPPILVIGDDGERPRFLASEVHGWLPPTAGPSELAAAIIAVAQNLVVLTPRQAERWLKRAEGGRDSDIAVETLTPRESQVLRMLANGMGNKEIAGQLSISDHTAKFHVAQILAKLGASSRTEAVALGIRRGLVPV